MHDLVHDLATLIMDDELTASYVASKRHRHRQKYCRYALITKYDQSINLSKILPTKVRALRFSDSGKLDIALGAFSFVKFLRILDFSGCSSTLLPASIVLPKQLKYLMAPRLQNEDLPEYITELPKLQYLNLNGSSRISALPESIGKLTPLRYLGLSGCSAISKLPGSFGDIKCMMHLDMSGCAWIRDLPDSLGNLTNLQRLELSECSVKAIPVSLCGLTQLQYLNLSWCRHIARLPEAIGNLVNLQHLNLSRCSGREFPESFTMLRNLLHLDLSNCPIEKGLPGALRGLTTLQYLDMSVFLHVQNLEKDDLLSAMRNLTNLKVLNLAYSLCNLFDLGKNDNSCLDFIGTLTNLEHLDLSSNKSLRRLPENFGNLKRLRALNLQNCCNLNCFPESIGGVTGLKSLRLDWCSHELMNQASSVLHYSLTLPLFKVHASDDVSGHSNLHLLEGDENIDELHMVALENVRFLEEAQTLKLVTKQSLLTLKLSWTSAVDRHLEDKDLLGQLVPPMSLKDLYLEGYSSPTFPSWVMTMSYHLPNLTRICLTDIPACSNLPPLGQLACLESLSLWRLPNITKIDRGICGSKGAFPRLAKFEVGFMEGLEEWNTTYPGEDGADEFMFPKLDELSIHSCKRLRLKPWGPKCRRFLIQGSDQVISSLEEAQTGSRNRSNCTQSTRYLHINFSNSHSFRLFHHFPALEELCFSGCFNLTDLPKGIQQLSSLETLKVLGCDSVTALPEWLSDISTLKRLKIRSCTSIKSLPPCIEQLTNLQEVVIHRNWKLKLWCESEENKAKLAHINHIDIYD